MACALPLWRTLLGVGNTVSGRRSRQEGLEKKGTDDVDLHEALAVAGIECHIADMHDMMDRLERTSLTRCLGTEDCR